MNRVESALRAAVEDLRASGVKVALVGGLAVSARTEPRFTRDVDLAIAVAGDREAERVANALTSRGYRIRSRGFHRDRDLEKLFEDASSRLGER